MLCEASKRKPQLEKSAPHRYLLLTLSMQEAKVSRGPRSLIRLARVVSPRHTQQLVLTTADHQAQTTVDHQVQTIVDIENRML
jgi:hypothetical protein